MPPIQDAAAWRRRTARTQRSLARALGIGLVALLALVVAGAWAIPPLLDWGRFRTAIAAIAGAQLGRTVQIGGDISLRLLPQAVLTASDVTLPEQGDGISARVAYLRLEVGLMPLLAGRLVVHDLVLGAPVLSLPWPLPTGMVAPERPRVPHAFAAHVENGRLRIGQAEITGITAAIHGGPTQALTPEAGPAAAFAAEGFAAFDGQHWRFATALGAPDADGISAVDLTVQGLQKAHETGGTIQGTLADGVFQGRIHAGGPDLSLIIPASPLAWHAEAPVTASGERILSSGLSLTLGGAPASAMIALQLAPPARLEARLSAATLDLDGWARLLSGPISGFALPAIPMRLDLSADSASLLGGTLGPLAGVLLFDGAHASLDHVTALLPGNAKLGFSGRITRAGNFGYAAEGPAGLDAPDLHATLQWLRPLAPALLDAMPDAVLRSGRLNGTASLSKGRIAVDAMQGTLDGVPVSGSFDLSFFSHPSLMADAVFDHLSIDSWLGGSGLHPGMTLAEFARPFSKVETRIHLKAATASWAGEALHDAVLEAQTGPAGLQIGQASATAFGGTKLGFSGTVGPGGTLAGVHAQGSTQDAARTLAALPASWRVLPGLWQGNANAELRADGPPGDVGLQLRADAGDLVMEAESRRNTLNGTAQATLTLRHPGVPRLLASLGIANAERFLDFGSLAALAHVHTAPGQLTLQDFSLEAASLSLAGHGDIDFSGAVPSVEFSVAADTLALPALASLEGDHWLDGLHMPAWHGDVELAAKTLTFGLQPLARDVRAALHEAAGDFAIDTLEAGVAGGKLHGQFAADGEKLALQAQLSAATIPGKLTGLPIDAESGGADVTVDLFARGRTEASLLGTVSGQAHLDLHDAHIDGFDLPRLTALLTAHPRGSRAELQAALSQGSSAGFSGYANFALEAGHAAISDSFLSSADGALIATGTIDLPASLVDVKLDLAPALPSPPHFTLHLSGPLHDAHATADLGLLPAPHRGKARRR